MLRGESKKSRDTKLIKLSTVKFKRLKSYIGQEAYSKNGKVIGVIRRIIAINKSRALYVEVDVNGGYKKLKASSVYVLPEKIEHVSDTYVKSTTLNSLYSLNNQVMPLNELMYKLLLINNSEIEIDVKYIRGFLPHETYNKIKRDLMKRREYLVRKGLNQIKSIICSKRINHEIRELVITLLTYAKIYLFERDSVSRQS